MPADSSWNTPTVPWGEGNGGMYLNPEDELGQEWADNLVYDAPSSSHHTGGIGGHFYTAVGSLSNPFEGSMAELRISSVARYTAPFIPQVNLETDSDTLALWRLNEGSGNTATDCPPRRSTRAPPASWHVHMQARVVAYTWWQLWWCLHACRSH